MATKYHISQDGTINICTARLRRCRLSSAQEHFASVEEAETYLDEVYSEKIQAAEYAAYRDERAELDTFYELTETFAQELAEDRYRVAQENGLLIDPKDLTEAWNKLSLGAPADDYPYRAERVALMANPFMDRETIYNYIEALEPYEALTLLEESPQTLPSWITEKIVQDNNADSWEPDASPEYQALDKHDILRQNNEFQHNLLYSAIPNLSEAESRKYATRDTALAAQYLSTNGWPTHLSEEDSVSFEAGIRSLVLKENEDDAYSGVAGHLAKNAKDMTSMRAVVTHPAYSVRVDLANNRNLTPASAAMLISSAEEKQYIGNYPQLRHELFFHEDILPADFRSAFLNDSKPTGPESASFPGAIAAQQQLVNDRHSRWESEKKRMDAITYKEDADSRIWLGLSKKVSALRIERDNAEAWIDAVDANYEKLSRDYEKMTSPEGSRKANPGKRADIMGRYDAATAFRQHEGDMKLLSRLMFDLDTNA